MLTYAIVTPARNERENLKRLAGSIIGQDHRPTSWIIVDDGSDDGMDAVARELALSHDWIFVTGTGEAADDLATGRRRGRDLLAFRKGLSVLPAPVDVFVKVDADTSFDQEYFARLLEHFQVQPDLGIAGGSCYELVDGAWQRIKVSGSHPRGASRAYRWTLLDDVFALEPELGWDGVDEVMAELRGYRTAGILDLGFRHHRKVGSVTVGSRQEPHWAGKRGTWDTGQATSFCARSTEPARTPPRSRWCADTVGLRSAALRSALTRLSPAEYVNASGSALSCDAEAGADSSASASR